MWPWNNNNTDYNEARGRRQQTKERPISSDMHIKNHWWPQIVISMKRPFNRRGRHHTKGWTMTTKRGIIIWILYNNKINSKASASDNDITKAYFTRSNLPRYKIGKRRLLHTLRNGMTPVATLGLRPVFYIHTLLMGVTDRKKGDKKWGKTPFFQLIFYFFYFLWWFVC